MTKKEYFREALPELERAFVEYLQENLSSIDAKSNPEAAEHLREMMWRNFEIATPKLLEESWDRYQALIGNQSGSIH